MAPEQEPLLVVVDLRFKGDELIGDIEYYDAQSPPDLVRIRWGFGEAPEGYHPVGKGVAFAADFSRRPDALGEPIPQDDQGRYSYAEGLGPAPRFILVMILPPGKTLDETNPQPNSSRTFGDRLAVYWILPAGVDKRAGVSWKLRDIGRDLKAELQVLNAGMAPMDEEWRRRKHQVFISYRREDSAWPAGRIDCHLVNKYGREAVFHDIDSIPPGRDFRKELDAAVGSCKVMLVVIGPQWTGLERNRLHDETDYVRIEVELALQRDMPVIPLFIDGSELDIETLPGAVKDLAYRQGLQVSASKFEESMARLINNIDALVKSR